MNQRELEFVRMGFELGYSNPTAEPGIPADEPYLTYYNVGVEFGRTSRAEADAAYDGPAIGPDRGGGDVSYEEYNRHTRELLEVLFHKHMPHIEEETEVRVMPGPGVR